MKYHWHIDCFSVGLDELPQRKQRNPHDVARILAETGEFSAFEATANPVIAKTMDWLAESGWFVFEPQGYPWTKATLTDAGRKVLALAPEATPGEDPSAMKRAAPTAERLAQVRKDAQAKRAELGLEPVPAETAEYERAQEAKRERRKR